MYPSLAITHTQDRNSWQITCKNRLLGTISPPRCLGHQPVLQSAHLDNTLRISWTGNGWDVQDLAGLHPLGGLSITRTLRNTQDSSRLLDLDVTLTRPGAPQFALIPGVQYHANHRALSNVLKGFEHQGQPWRFAASRTTIPGATITRIDTLAAALFIPVTDPDSLDAACSLLPRENVCEQIIHFPAGESPCSYTAVESYSPAWENKKYVPSQQSLTVHAHIAFEEVEDQSNAFHAIFRQAWKILGSEVTHWHPPRRILDLCRQYVLDHLVAHEDDAILFSIGLLRRNDRWLQRPANKYEIGWCGQNASLAASMLEWSLETNDPSLWSLGQNVLDSWIRLGKPVSPLLPARLDSFLSHTSPGPIESCNLGCAITEYFRAYRLSQQAKKTQDHWFRTALDICTFLLSLPDDQPRFPAAFSPDAAPLSADTTMGAFLIPGMIHAHHLTDDPVFLDRACQAFWAYIHADLADWQCTGGAVIGEPTVDFESAIPLLKAALLLLETTSDPAYLTAACDAACYLVSWMYHYDVPFPSHTFLHQMDYRTTGGTGVSAMFQHIDPFGACIAPDLLELAEITGDSYWREVGLAIWNQSTIGVWDGRPVPDRIERPLGSQDEAFCQTHWGFLPEHIHATTKWLVAWPAAFHIQFASEMIQLTRGTVSK